MLNLDPKEVLGLLEWAGLPLPKAPLRQRTAREKEKAGQVFTPKARRAAPEREPRAEGTTGRPAYGARPDAAGRADGRKTSTSPARKPAQSRRIRQDADIPAPRSRRPATKR